MSKKDFRICVDRVVPLRWKAEAAALAVKENPANGPRGLRMMPGASSHPLKMALFTGKRWKPGRTLGVRFLDGTKTQRIADGAFREGVGEVRQHQIEVRCGPEGRGPDLLRGRSGLLVRRRDGLPPARRLPRPPSPR